MKKFKVVLILLFITMSLYAQGMSEGSFQTDDFSKTASVMLLQAMINNSFVDKVDTTVIQVVDVPKYKIENSYLKASTLSDKEIEDLYKEVLIDLLNSNDLDNNSYDVKNDIVNLDIKIQVLSLKRPDIKASLTLLRSIFMMVPNLSYDMFIDKEVIEVLPKNKFKTPYDLFRATSKSLYLELNKNNTIYNIYPFVYINLEQ